MDQGSPRLWLDLVEIRDMTDPRVKHKLLIVVPLRLSIVAPLIFPSIPELSEYMHTSLVSSAAMSWMAALAGVSFMSAMVHGDHFGLRQAG